MTAPPGPALPDPRPTADKDARLVQQMFDRVAPRYDVANTVFSLGQDRHWRRVAARAAAPRPGDLVLDVASGTGMLAGELRAAGARVVAVDFSLAMLATGARRDQARSQAGEGVLWCTGDGLRLPFADASADVLTIAFGLRNLPDAAGGLAEFRRVVRPGGRLVVLEFSQPTWPLFGEIYRRYLVGAIPRAAQVLTSDPAAYRYLADSILEWPDQQGLGEVMAAAGWAHVQWQSLSGGIVALHRATHP